MNTVVHRVRSTERQFDAGTVIFEQGAPGDVAYVIVAGEVEIYSTVDGTELILARLGEGQLFGEMAMFDPSGLRSASARAVGPVLVREFDRLTLLHHMSEDPVTAMSIMRRLTDRVRSANEQIVHGSLASLELESDEERARPAEGGFLDRILPWREKPKQTIAAFQPDVVEIEHRPVPAAVFVTLYAIVGLAVGAVAWASASFVETFVSTEGRLKTTVSNVVVQPRETSVIKELAVDVGQTVRAGQTLATLDATYAQADISASRATVASLSAQRARLVAEFEGKSPSGFSDDPSEDAMQRDIFLSRMNELASRVRTFDEAVARLEQEIESLGQERRFVGSRVEVLKELEGAYRKLLSQNATSRVQFLQTKDNRIAMEQQYLQLGNQVKKLENTIKGKNSERQAFLAEWRSRLGQELVSLEREWDTASEQLKKLERRGENVALLAPVDGVVLDLGGHAVGSVVREADPLITLVPIDVPIEAEVDIAPKDIGKLHHGDIVKIKLEALPFQRHGYIEGRLRYLSEDTYERDLRGGRATVYRGRISLDDHTRLVDLPSGFRLIPGMNLTADITVGERRLITYFLYPVMRWVDASFREP